jgi:hypothetical protein
VPVGVDEVLEAAGVAVVVLRGHEDKRIGGLEHRHERLERAVAVQS